MRITDLKINGIKRPVGFAFPRISLSWKVVEAKDTTQSDAIITVSTEPDLSNPVWVAQSATLKSIGTAIDIQTKPHTRYYYRVEVWSDGGDYAASEIDYFETAKQDEPWVAKYIGTAAEDEFHPVFVKRFSKPANTERASICLTGLGLYEAYLNGTKIGDEYLAPNVNDYSVRVQYQTYDITDLLQEENEICIYCGNGFYKGRFGYDGHVKFFGDRFGTIAEIHILDAAGADTIVATDESWQYRASDIMASDIYDGETVDRMYGQEHENPLKPVAVLDFDTDKLVERYSLPVRVKEVLPVRDVIRTDAGEIVLDFGQNFAGFVSFPSTLPKGCEITLDFGEILQNGNFYNDNYRSAKSQFIYRADGRTETVRAHFTYYGFRYVRVTGWPGQLPANEFKGNVIYSDLDNAIAFETGHAGLNRLHLNCLWGQKSNFIDIPTDCPQRDERLGWTGDAQVFSPTACYQMDTRAFYRKFMLDLRTEQQKLNGAIPHYIPNNNSAVSGSSVWGDVATFLPMTLYDVYGDLAQLEEAYPMMQDWIGFIRRGDEEHGNRHLWDFGFHFGDWLAQDGVTAQSMKGGTDDYYVASVYYYASVCKIAKAAQLLGKEQDAKEYTQLSAEIREAILNEYFSQSGRLCIDTQTGYLLALRYAIYRDKEKLLEGFRVRLKKDCFKIKGGFVGAPIMCQTLAENGMEQLAYEILLQEGFPGWMHCINLGATTIWERWNSVLDDGSISGTEMNSLNHYAYGSVMEYVYRHIAGIQSLAPGFAKVQFAPQPNCKLGHLHCAYDSVSGRYVSDWKINEDGTLTVHFEVPFNACAVAILPGTDGRTVELKAGVYEETYRPNVDYRMRYSMDTRLNQLKDDEEAMAILAEDLPAVVGIIKSNDAESLSMSFADLQFMFFWGFNPEIIQKGCKRVLELKN